MRLLKCYRKKSKHTKEIDAFLDQIFEEKKRKKQEIVDAGNVFDLKYEFKSIDEAKVYKLEEKLIEFNKNSKIEEKEKLFPIRSKYDLA